MVKKQVNFVLAGWWEPVVTTQAAPMLCIPKKTHALQTVIDSRNWNENTHKDVTPMPDQDNIRNSVARSCYRTKINISDAYEQMRVHPDDIWKTAFSTVYGCYVSNVMMMGDCNAPSTFQQFMTHIFKDYIGRFCHVYLDDIFVYSNTIEDHEKHIQLIVDKLLSHELSLNKDKCDLYSEQLDCLGHVINNQGVHADTDKMTKIREWRTPRNYN
jgi:Reverse transcriptase (RNA-dependent DNA polymerase)